MIHERYTKIEKVGEGGFGKVYKYFDEKSKQYVAIKKMKMLEMGNIEGVDFTTLREIKYLKELNHQNILKILDVFTHKQTINVVYEFLDMDLEEVLLDSDLSLSPGDIKCLMRMMLEAVHHLHCNWIIHRDLKPGNMLLSRATGELKIGDLGLSREFGSSVEQKFTPNRVTRWYRSPELLFGGENYGPPVDIWSLGCIFAELMLKNPLFPGDDDFDQLSKIFTALGTPTEEIWPGMKSLPNYMEFQSLPPSNLKLLFTAATVDALDFLTKMLRFDPQTRITAGEALRHPYFQLEPHPTEKTQLPFPRKKIAKRPMQPIVNISKHRQKIFQALNFDKVQESPLSDHLETADGNNNNNNAEIRKRKRDAVDE